MKKHFIPLLLIGLLFFTSCKTTNLNRTKTTAENTVKVMISKEASIEVIFQLKQALPNINFVYTDNVDFSKYAYYLVIVIDGYNNNEVLHQASPLTGPKAQHGFGGTANGKIYFTYMEFSKNDNITSIFTKLINKGNFFPPEMMDLFNGKVNNLVQTKMDSNEKVEITETAGSNKSKQEYAIDSDYIPPWFIDKNLTDIIIIDDIVLLKNINTEEEKPILKFKADHTFFDNGAVKLNIKFFELDNIVEKIDCEVFLAEKRNNNFGYTISKEVIINGESTINFDIPNPSHPYQIEKYIIKKLKIDFSRKYTKGNLFSLSYPSLPHDKNIIMSFRSSGIDLWSTNENFSNLISPQSQKTDPSGTRNLAQNIKLSDRGNDIIFNGESITFPFTVSKDQIFDIVKLNLGRGKFNTGNDSEYFGNNDTIILIDRSLLDKTYYLTADQWNSERLRSNMDLPDLIKTLASNHGYLDTGAVIITPFDPIDFKSTDTGLKFSLNWSYVRDISTIDIKISPEKFKAANESLSEKAIYFRSSGIDLWSADGDYSNLLSELFIHRDPQRVRHLSKLLKLADDHNNIVFNGPEVLFNMNVKEDKKIDFIMVNLGSGKFSRNIINSESIRKYSIDCIIFVDISLLEKKYYVPFNDWKEMGIVNNPEYPSFINKFIYDNRGFIDAKGTVFIPFDPVNFSTNNTKIGFSFHWPDIETPNIDLSIKVY